MAQPPHSSHAAYPSMYPPTSAPNVTHGTAYPPLSLTTSASTHASAPYPAMSAIGRAVPGPSSFLGHVKAYGTWPDASQPAYGPLAHPQGPQQFFPPAPAHWPGPVHPQPSSAPPAPASVGYSRPSVQASPAQGILPQSTSRKAVRKKVEHCLTCERYGHLESNAKCPLHPNHEAWQEKNTRYRQDYRARKREEALATATRGGGSQQ
jgi:hypothetical protein